MMSSEEIPLANYIYRSPNSSDENRVEVNNVLSELAGLKYQLTHGDR